jgi:hypothetical protein
VNRNPSTFLRRGRYIYRLAQEPAPAPEDELTEEEREYHRILQENEDELQELSEKYHEDLPKTLQKIGEDAQKYMQTHGVKSYGLEKGPIPTKDGVDLVYDIGVSGTPEAKLRFDYSSTWLSKMKDFVMDEYSQAFSKLNEVIFEYCDHAFVATQKAKWEDLMKSIGLLQSIDSRPREDLGALTKNEADRLDYALGMVQDLITKQGYDPDVLLDKNKALEAFIEDKEKLRITDAVWDAIEPVIENIPDDQWKEKIKSYGEELSARRFVPSRELVEEKVDFLTRHEQYGGQVAIDYAPDGNLIAAINAPYPFLYVFDRTPGAQIKLVYAAMEFCNLTHIATTEAEAKKLITANLDFAEAFATAANPENEVNTEEAENLQELVSIFQKLTRKEMIAFLQEKYPQLSEDKIEELLRQITKGGFKRKTRLPEEE